MGDFPTRTTRPARRRARRCASLRLAVSPCKVHLLLVEALAGLRELDWRLTCIGSLERDRATAEAVRRAIADKRLGERITLAGECTLARVSAAYRDADVFVLPSYEEGY